MAYKRTTQKFGNRRVTTTYNTKTGTTTRSETSAQKMKPGQTRVTTSYGGGKSSTTYTTNLGGGYYNKETSGGIEARRRKQQKENQQMWAALFGTKKTKRKAAGPSGIRSFFGWACLIVVGLMLFNLK